MFGILTTSEIEEVIMHQTVGRLGCHADDTTYVVPISYAYDGMYIYAHTTEGMKVNIMRKNPKVCFQVDRMNNMANWQSVISWGHYQELTETVERNRALKRLMDRVLPLLSSTTTHLSPYWPFLPNDISSIKGIVFRILLTEKTGRFEK
jgi:nitroimidazol reductase NimA-like FMN-containing flavoprotein (pyridoxamine 5'-phosphate oxidase superfamily)